MSRAKRVSDDDILTALADIAGSRPMGQLLDPMRHHPFPARMPLTLAEHLISRLTTPDSVILDPMVGSGTTVVAGKRLGRKCLGFDRDPLACLVARTAINEYRRAELESLGDRVFRRAKEIARSVSVPEHRSLSERKKNSSIEGATALCGQILKSRGMRGIGINSPARRSPMNRFFATALYF